MTTVLPLGGKIANGRVALIDDADAWVLGHRWSLQVRGYSQARVDGRVVVLHRLLLHFPSAIVDHINRDKLDNRRANLRITDAQGNARNQSKRSGKTSRFMGVYRHTRTGRWVATGRTDRSVYLGCFATEEAAAEASRNWRVHTLGYDRVSGDWP